MYLFINTASSENIYLALVNQQGRVVIKKNIRAKYQQSEKLLPGVQKLMGRNLKKLKGIIIVKGPGSFTALRIGVATANTLAWALQIPVIGVSWNEKEKMEDLIKNYLNKLKKIKKFKAVWPEYGQEPNITKARGG